MSSRRDFLKTTCGFSGVLISGSAVAALLESCTSVKFISAAEVNGVLSVNKNEFLQQSFVVVKTSALAFPVYLAKITTANSSGERENYSALFMRCTHKQCEVKPAGSVLYCPCHGSEFSTTGKVLKEPASVDLEKFPVSSDTQNIYIHLK